MGLARLKTNPEPQFYGCSLPIHWYHYAYSCQHNSFLFIVNVKTSTDKMCSNNVCRSRNMHIKNCIHTYIQSFKYTYKQSYIHTIIHTYNHIYIQSYIHTIIHTYNHTYIQTNVHTLTYIENDNIHIYIYIDTHTHTHTHTHNHRHRERRQALYH